MGLDIDKNEVPLHHRYKSKFHQDFQLSLQNTYHKLKNSRKEYRPETFFLKAQQEKCFFSPQHLSLDRRWTPLHSHQVLLKIRGVVNL